MKVKYLIAAILIPITLASCGSVQQNPQPIILKPLVIPDTLKVKDHEWACLAKPKKERVKCPAFIKLVKRDKLKDARILTLTNKLKAFTN